MTIKNPTSFRLSDKAVECLAQLAKHLSVSRTSVLELAVRQLARKELGAGQGKRPKGTWQLTANDRGRHRAGVATRTGPVQP